VLGVAVVDPGVLAPGVDDGDGDTVSGGVEGLGLDPLSCGPSTHTITAVNPATAPAATTAVTTSRRGRGGRYWVRRGGLIAS
jgi:hypothetical protein